MGQLYTSAFTFRVVCNLPLAFRAVLEPPRTGLDQALCIFYPLSYQPRRERLSPAPRSRWLASRPRQRDFEPQHVTCVGRVACQSVGPGLRSLFNRPVPRVRARKKAEKNNNNHVHVWGIRCEMHRREQRNIQTKLLVCGSSSWFCFEYPMHTGVTYTFYMGGWIPQKRISLRRMSY